MYQYQHVFTSVIVVSHRWNLTFFAFSNWSELLVVWLRYVINNITKWVNFGKNDTTSMEFGSNRDKITLEVSRSVLVGLIDNLILLFRHRRIPRQQILRQWVIATKCLACWLIWLRRSHSLPVGDFEEVASLICRITAERSTPNFGFRCRSVSQNSLGTEPTKNSRCH